MAYKKTGGARAKKILLTALCCVLAVILIALLLVTIIADNLLGQIQRPSDEQTLSSSEIEDILNGDTADVTGPTIHENDIDFGDGTVEIIDSNELINIMLIGQNQNLADTMILCSLNRETQSLTMVSFLRDLYVPIPAYAGHGADRNRINSCYYWGSKWTGKASGGMELLAKCVEQNFGIPVDHSIAVDFDVFSRAVDVLGGVEIELTEKEARYLTNSVGYVGKLEPGLQTLNGTEALAYARIRKIDSDIQRTERQRKLLASLAEKCRGLSLLQLDALAKTVLPMVTTDMTEQEITSFLWEFLPLVKKLELRSMTCPVDNGTLPGSRWDKKAEIGGTLCDVIECNIRRNREYLTELLGTEE